MGGKATLLLVLGFSMIFMVTSKNFNNMATKTTSNLVSYYSHTKSRYLAISGVNIVVNKLWLNAAANDTVFNLNFDGGTIRDSLITTNAVLNERKIVSIAIYNGDTSVTKIMMKPSQFSKYAYFSNVETSAPPSSSTIYWGGKDTVDGPMHTNGNLNFNGNAVFKGNVSYGGTEYKNGNNPVYMGRKDHPVSIPMPTGGVQNISNNASGGATFTGNPKVYFEFRGDSIRYRFSTSGTGSTWTYRLASSFAPNGVIFFQNAEVHIKGVVKGNYTIASAANSSATGEQGSFYIDDDIRFYNDPDTRNATHPSTPTPPYSDILGMVATNNVIVADNAANGSNVIIQAAIYTEKGSFKVQNHDRNSTNDSDYPGYNFPVLRGSIVLYGGISQKYRGAVGTGSGGTMSTGYSKRYKYDDRLLYQYPPFYPGCGFFEVISWME